MKIVTLSGSDETKSSDTASVTSSIDRFSISQSSVSSSSTAFTPPASFVSGQSTTPKGSLTLFDKNGNPRALINAEEITAFRTALASTMFFKKRQNVHDLVVFGAGKQAYWHIRLALLLRGEDVHHLNIINRNFDRVSQMLMMLWKPHLEPSEWGTESRATDSSTKPAYVDLPRPKIQILTPSHAEYDRLLKSTIRASSVIFFTTPSLTPLFPAPFLTNPEGRKKGRYLAAIGSYKPHMIEIHPDILRQNVAPEHGHRHFHKHALQSGAVVVDSVEACMREAGEVIQAGLKADEVVEIGELLMLKRDAERRRQECINSRAEQGLDEVGVELGECEKAKKRRRGSKPKDGETEDKAQKSLMEWLKRGNVIYKSVGLGLMDVVVGTDLVRLADERGIGTRIENF